MVLWYEYSGRVTSGEPNTVLISNVALFTPPKLRLRSRLDAAACLMAGPSAAAVVERKDTSAAGEAAAAAAWFWLKRRDCRWRTREEGPRRVMGVSRDMVLLLMMTDGVNSIL